MPGHTFRDYDRLEIENGQAAVTAHYGDRSAFEAAVEEAGLDLYSGGKTWQGRDGRFAAWTCLAVSV